MKQTNQPIRRLSLLGSTGSIGTQSLEVVRHLQGAIQIAALSAGRRVAELIEQAREFKPSWVHVSRPEDAREVSLALGDAVRVVWGPDGLCEIARESPADIVIVATVGWTGLEPTLAALAAGRQVALANKEVLVCGGELVMSAARRAGTEILPIDSEHSAIAQCLAAGRRNEVRRIVLTCSGGPYLNATWEEILEAPAERTLRHPTWDMGRKISVDSATLVNKGFEVIEAAHLFGLPLDQVDVVVHPQSIVHGLVEFADGSLVAQLSTTDMRLPIQYALTHPQRERSDVARLDLASLGTLTFQKPDTKRFPCLAMAYEAARRGGTVPCVLNAANEVAVAAHLDGTIPCGSIPRLISDVLASHTPVEHPTLERLREADGEGRRLAHSALANLVEGRRVLSRT